MNKKTFIQQSVIQLLNNQCVTDKPKSERFDYAISLAELAWQKLTERGYGCSKEREPENKDWYAEIINKSAFDKAWQAYKKIGSRNQAARAWLAIPSTEHERIMYAIPRYRQQCQETGTAICHFATWLHQRRFESFDIPAEQPQKAANDSGKQEIFGKIRHIETLIKFAKSADQRAALESELVTLKKRAVSV